MQWQMFLDVVIRKIRSPRLTSEIKAQSNSENELLFCLLAGTEIRKLVSLWLNKQRNNKECKSLEKAKVLKAIGNKEFQRKDYAASIESYTKSAQLAPANSEDLSLAIANRSASLFYLGRYQESIKDIDLAILLNHPENLRYKLYFRKAQCHLKLGQRKAAEIALSHVQNLTNGTDEIPDVKRENLEKEIARLTSLISCMQESEEESVPVEPTPCAKPEPAFGVNENFSSASAALECKFTPEKGRHVVTNRDVSKGQILFVEEPFAFVLLDHDKTSALCDHCCRPYGDTAVPCTKCNDTVFCSAECWTEGWRSYHQWECAGSRMNLWQQIGIAHLVLNLLLRCTSTTDIKRFNDIQKLTTNIDKFSPSDLIVYSTTATMLTEYLYQYTDYFKDIDIKESLVNKFTDPYLNFECDISTEDGKRLYISSLLLRHTLQLIINGHAITKLILTPGNKDKVATEQQDRVATGIFPSASMMNHSCDPNIINSFWNQHLVVKATRDIPSGEEVFNCYGPHFRRMSRDRRQEILRNQYCFTCECEPCTSLELRYFLERFTALKCLECNGPLYDLRTYSYHCLDCGATPCKISYEPQLKQAQELFDEAQVCMELEKEHEALVKLKECLSIRRNILYKYHEDITLTLDHIAKVYAMMGCDHSVSWLGSITYLEHAINNVEERYGSDSIELANELNKLTDICIQYLHEETNTYTKHYKNVLKKTRRLLDRAEDIFNLNYGSWNDACQEIRDKKQRLYAILKDFNL